MDLCENITCLNGGVCNAGVCDCTAGYTGDSCQTGTKHFLYKLSKFEEMSHT